MKQNVVEKILEKDFLHHFWIVISAPLEDEKNVNKNNSQKSKSYNNLSLFGTVRPWVN